MNTVEFYKNRQLRINVDAKNMKDRFQKGYRPSGCPGCGLMYLALYRKSHSVCPACRADVYTDIRVIRIIEACLVAPIFWLFATALRLALNDAMGIISYALLILPARLLDVWVVRRFVTPRMSKNENA
ncbi:hypothetical protein ABE501_00895 [Comamonas testosteroni]